MNITDTIQYRKQIRNHKQKLLAIALKETKFQKTMSQHKELYDQVSHTINIKKNYVAGEKKKENEQHEVKYLNKLLTIHVPDQQQDKLPTLKNYVPKNYNENKAKLTDQKEKNREKMVATISNHNDALIRKMIKVKSSIEAKKLNSEWKDHRKHYGTFSQKWQHENGRNKTEDKAEKYLRSLQEEDVDRSSSYNSNLGYNSNLNVERQSKLDAINYNKTPLKIGKFTDDALSKRFTNQNQTAQTERVSHKNYNIASRRKGTDSKNDMNMSYDQVSNFGTGMVSKNQPNKILTNQGSKRSLSKHETPSAKDRSKKMYTFNKTQGAKKDHSDSVTRLNTENDHINKDTSLFNSTPQKKFKSSNLSSANSTKSFKKNLSLKKKVSIFDKNSKKTEQKENYTFPVPDSETNNSFDSVENTKKNKDSFPDVVSEKTEPNNETARNTKNAFFEKGSDNNENKLSMTFDPKDTDKKATEENIDNSEVEKQIEIDPNEIENAEIEKQIEIDPNEIENAEVEKQIEIDPNEIEQKEINQKSIINVKDKSDLFSKDADEKQKSAVVLPDEPKADDSFDFLN